MEAHPQVRRAVEAGGHPQRGGGLQFEVERQPEADRVAQKTKEDPEYAKTWADMKERFEVALMKGVRSKFKEARVASEESGDEVSMVVRPTFFRMGHYTYVASPPTVVVADVQYVKGGQPLDEVTVSRTYKPTSTRPSVWNHWHESATDIGVAAAGYRAKRSDSVRGAGVM